VSVCRFGSVGKPVSQKFPRFIVLVCRVLISRLGELLRCPSVAPAEHCCVFTMGGQFVFGLLRSMYVCMYVCMYLCMSVYSCRARSQTEADTRFVKTDRGTVCRVRWQPDLESCRSQSEPLAGYRSKHALMVSFFDEPSPPTCTLVA
jgi:hypothetical protein